MKDKSSTRPFTGKTDWERLRNMTDEEAYANALADPDAQPMTPEMLSRAVLVTPKLPVSIRLDLDVLLWFKKFGPRYQTRINAVLKEFMQHQKRIATPRKKSKRATPVKRQRS